MTVPMFKGLFGSKAKEVARVNVQEGSGPSVAPVQPPTAPMSISAGTSHVMFSYPWGKHQDLVRMMAQHLKSQGVDVWTDTEGSSLLGNMRGNTDEVMAKAVELSSHVVVFVAKKYLSSMNCQREVCCYIFDSETASRGPQGDAV